MKRLVMKIILATLFLFSIILVPVILTVCVHPNFILLINLWPIVLAICCADWEDCEEDEELER